jgi:type VI secretion system protein ImpM
MAASTLTDRISSHPVPQASMTHSFSWFGKLPSAGDFISRRMAYELQQFWDRWCAEGMEALKADSTATGLDVWGGTPKWAFILPAQPQVQGGQFGVFAPSCDRVGRIFPFIVTVPVVQEWQATLLDRAGLLGGAWGQIVGQAQESRWGTEAVDAALHDALAMTLATEPAIEQDAEATLPLNTDALSLPWPDLGRNFDLGGPTSYWWSVPAQRTGFQSRTHTGALKTAHFLDLCR